MTDPIRAAEAADLPPLPEPAAWNCYWRGDNDGPSWDQWHDASDPMPAQWEGEAPDEVTPHYTAEQMHAYAREYAALRAALPGLREAGEPMAQWVSVDDRLPTPPDDGSDVPVWTWNGEFVSEDDYAGQFEQPAGPAVGGWISTGWDFYQNASVGRAAVTHWMPRETPKPPTKEGAPT